MKGLAGWVLLGWMAGMAGAQTPATVQAEAKPAMWSVKGVHGTVYLFGTLHVMRPEVRWETAKVKAALASSGVLYTEIDDVGEAGMKAAQPLVMSMGLDPDHPLSTKIAKEDVAVLDGLAKSLGMVGESAVEPMQPWLVYLTISVLPAIRAGYDPASGIDRKLQDEAKAAGKRVLGFETMADQIHLVADMSTAEQVALLHQELVDLPKSVAQLDEIVADWTTGEVEKIAAMDNDELKVKYPVLYERMLVKRNAGFAGSIAGMLKDPAAGTVFVAIGAGHLAGPDSVLKMLEARGFVVVRE